MAESIRIDALNHLPLRAITAFAARCARRVQPLFKLEQPEKKRNQEHVRAIEALLRAAEEFANGQDLAEAGQACFARLDAGRDARTAAGHSPAERVATAALAAARSVVYAARGPTDTAAVVAREAESAAKEAAGAEGSLKFAAALAKDYSVLLRLPLGKYPEVGEPVDPSEAGPLGPLWLGTAPEWYRTA